MIFSPSTPPDPPSPDAVCHAIARRNGSPLFLVSRLLGGAKRRLFISAYAAMRVIDDLVDENFFAMSHDQRRVERDRILERVETWRLQARAASRGGFAPREDSFHPDVFLALNDTIGQSDVGDWPWNALADAMRHDVHEQEIVTWEDFLAYCEGATVSPAATFAYILACEAQDGRYRLNRPDPFCRDQVRDMAIFCYLIHIARDLAKDARKDRQLITIPTEMLAEAGFRRDTLAAGLDRKASLIPLIRALTDRASERLATGLDTISRLPLRTLERWILDRLLKKYRDLHLQLIENPLRYL
ncbi:MAG: squalene/phytoene synthase family protein [Magnetococcales bacterium]|nr:squalene/phytoene synthase family protein [Magnetococcales bacterium]MBF0262153.1 squalene/phytoene synthase family protein [Magnetococcales bacterium]